MPYWPRRYTQSLKVRKNTIWNVSSLSKKSGHKRKKHNQLINSAVHWHIMWWWLAIICCYTYYIYCNRRVVSNLWTSRLVTYNFIRYIVTSAVIFDSAMSGPDYHCIRSQGHIPLVAVFLVLVKYFIHMCVSNSWWRN